jgi:hypothetical protein
MSRKVPMIQLRTVDNYRTNEGDLRQALSSSDRELGLKTFPVARDVFCLHRATRTTQISSTGMALLRPPILKLFSGRLRSKNANLIFASQGASCQPQTCKIDERGNRQPNPKTDTFNPVYDFSTLWWRCLVRHVSGFLWPSGSPGRA